MVGVEAGLYLLRHRGPTVESGAFSKGKIRRRSLGKLRDLKARVAPQPPSDRTSDPGAPLVLAPPEPPAPPPRGGGRAVSAGGECAAAQGQREGGAAPQLFRRRGRRTEPPLAAAPTACASGCGGAHERE